MPDPVTMILNHESIDPLDELSRMSLQILKENGWQVDRLQPRQNVLLTAVPYYTRDEEKIVAARIEAMQAAHKHRIGKASTSLSRYCLSLTVAPLVYGLFAMFTGQSMVGTYCMLGAAIFAGMAIAIEFKEALRG